MGYTHYFGFRGGYSPTRGKFALAVDIFKNCLKEIPNIVLCDAFGKGGPDISHHGVSFNGCAKTDDDHEAFEIWIKGSDGFNFCKTTLRPYDIACCLCLLAFKEVFGDDFHYSSDGVTREDIANPSDYMVKFSKEHKYTYKIEPNWQKAYEIFDKVVGKDIRYSTEYKYTESNVDREIRENEIRVLDGFGEA